MKGKAATIVLTMVIALMLNPGLSPHTAVYAAAQPEAETLFDAIDAAIWRLDRAEKEQKEVTDSAASAESRYDSASGDYSAALERLEDKESASLRAARRQEKAAAAKAEAAEELTAAGDKEEAAVKALTRARTRLLTLRNEKEGAEIEAENARLALKEANLRWAQEQTAAQAALKEAEEDDRDAGFDFINSRTNALGEGYFPITEIIENEERSSYEMVAWDGKTKLKMSQIVKDKDFKDIVKGLCSYENLQQGIAFIEHANMLRTSDRHELEELKVSYQLVSNAIVSTAVTAYARGHNLVESSDYRYWTVDTPADYRPRNEDLAYSTTPVHGEFDYDPFDSWYYEDRIIEAGQEEGGVTQEIIDEVIAEARADGRDYDPYKNRTREGFLRAMQEESTTGHYQAIVDPKTTAVGAAYTCVPEEYEKDYMTDPSGWTYSAKACLSFNNTEINTITVREYEKEMNEYFEACQENLEAARAEVKRLETEPEYVEEAKAASQEAEDNLIEIQKAAAEAEEDKRAEEEAGVRAETELDIKKAAYNAAVTSETKANEEILEAGQVLRIAERDADMKKTVWDKASKLRQEAAAALAISEKNTRQARASYREKVSGRSPEKKEAGSPYVSRLLTTALFYGVKGSIGEER